MNPLTYVDGFIFILMQKTIAFHFQPCYHKNVANNY